MKQLKFLHCVTTSLPQMFVNLILKIIHGAHYFYDLRFPDITGLSRPFLKEFKDIFLQTSGQSRTHFIYLEKL